MFTQVGHPRKHAPTFTSSHLVIGDTQIETEKNDVVQIIHWFYAQ